MQIMFSSMKNYQNLLLLDKPVGAGSSLLIHAIHCGVVVCEYVNRCVPDMISKDLVCIVNGLKLQDTEMDRHSSSDHKP